jgi:hypothetical protein
MNFSIWVFEFWIGYKMGVNIPLCELIISYICQKKSFKKEIYDFKIQNLKIS